MVHYLSNSVVGHRSIRQLNIVQINPDCGRRERRNVRVSATAIDKQKGIYSSLGCLWRTRVLSVMMRGRRMILVGQSVFYN